MNGFDSSNSVIFLFVQQPMYYTRLSNKNVKFFQPTQKPTHSDLWLMTICMINMFVTSKTPIKSIEKIGVAPFKDIIRFEF